MFRIMVVDDEENILKLYQTELALEGYQVTVATSGDEALSKAQFEKPDLVVLDVKLEGRDGLDTLSHLKQTNKRLPVILNTAYDTYKHNFQSWLAEDYVIKSADLTALKEKIRALLSV